MTSPEPETDPAEVRRLVRPPGAIYGVPLLAALVGHAGGMLLANLDGPSEGWGAAVGMVLGGLAGGPLLFFVALLRAMYRDPGPGILGRAAITTGLYLGAAVIVIAALLS